MIGEALPGAAAAFLVTMLGVPPAAWIARRTGAVSQPRADRLGGRVVPVLGGLATTAGLVAGLLVAGMLTDRPATPERLAIIGGIATLLLVGIVDDRRSMTPRARLLVQALIGVGLGALMTDGMEIWLRVAGCLAGLVAVTAIVNATNLVDNADGLSSALSAVSAAALAGAAVVLQLPSSALIVGFVAAGACLGFLLHNRPPARIFLGDTGSLPLGFILAATALLLVRDALDAGGDLVLQAMVLAGLAFAVQFGDVAMVVVTRLRRGVSPMRGGIDHTSHRLMLLGMGNGAMLVSLTLLSVGLQIVTLLGATLDSRLGPLIAAPAVAGVILGLEAFVVRATPETRDTKGST